MARVFITGSADGLGQLSAQLLVEQGHEVALHARDMERGRIAMKNTPGAKVVLTADLSNIAETKELAEKVNALGQFDAIIHNAGVYQTSARQIFSVNTLAPYILTNLIKKPKRLVYLSSGMHLNGRPKLEHFKDNVNLLTYSDSKLHVMMLTLVVARAYPEIYSNAVDPGWVPTKMGGKSAPDDLQKGYETQTWLAASNDEHAKVSGRYFFHQKERAYNSIANDVTSQKNLITLLEDITDVPFKVD